ELVRLNRAGAGVFVMVNEGDGRGRTAKNVRALRALFVDDDSGELTPQALEVPPSIFVQSRNGPHAYWCLRAGEPVDAFRPAQEQLAAALRTDDRVKDPPRVMRLPGFFHVKDPRSPFLVRVVQTSGARYSIAEVLAGYPAPIAQPERGTVSRARPSVEAPRVVQGDAALQRASRYLARISPAIS